MILEFVWFIFALFIMAITFNIIQINNFIPDFKNINQNKQFVELKKELFNNESKNWILNILTNSNLYVNFTNNVSFVNNRNKVNFLSLDIWELKWSFTVYLEYWKNRRTAVLWLVCKNNDKSSDYQFPNLTNKISLSDKKEILNLDDSKNYFDNQDCFYFQLAPEEITTSNINRDKNLWKQITFVSNNWIKNVSIVMFFQKTKINDPTFNYIEWQSWKSYYEWIRYIIRKDTSNTILKLNNFYIIYWWNKYWVWSNFLESVTFQTPMIFYTR